MSFKIFFHTLVITILLGFQATTTHAAVIYRPTTTKHNIKKASNKLSLKHKKKLKRRIQKTQEVNILPIILISVGLILLGLILGAIYAIPALWITCLSLLAILITIGIIFLLMLINAPFGCS